MVALHQPVSCDLGPERLPSRLSTLRRLRDRVTLPENRRDAGRSQPRRNWPDSAGGRDFSPAYLRRGKDFPIRARLLLVVTLMAGLAAMASAQTKPAPKPAPKPAAPAA